LSSCHSEGSEESRPMQRLTAFLRSPEPGEGSGLSMTSKRL